MNQGRAYTNQSVLAALLVIVALLIGLIVGFFLGFFVGGAGQSAATGQDLPRPVQEASTPQSPAAAQPMLEQSDPGASDPQGAGTAAGAEPTIPLPVSRTATPMPLSLAVLQISEAHATALAGQKIGRTPAGSFVSALAVRILPEGLELTGDINDPSGTVGSGAMVVRGELRLEGGNLRFYTTSATINGAPVPDDLRSQLEGVVADMLRDELGNRKVEDLQLAPGVLTVTVVQL